MTQNTAARRQYLSDDDRRRLLVLLHAHGETAVANILRVSRGTVLRAAAGMSQQPGTVLLLATALEQVADPTAMVG